ncbi:MAG TPA: hypothetical protein VGF91_14840 [Solirubrobacteraceae bacterium]
MTVIVSIETVLLVLLIVLVAALLRSHAEILRRLGPDGAVERARAPSSLPRPRPGLPADAAAPDLAGVTPTGDAIQLSFDGPATLLAFLSSGCTGCAGFWETLGERRLPADLQTLIVTRGPDREQRAKLRSLAPETVAVVMSSEAWEDYAVPGSPYFVLIEDGAVRGEGVATTWQALSSLLGDAIAEQREIGADARHRRIDETLAGAGIGPDHPSLYPGGSA